MTLSESVGSLVGGTDRSVRLAEGVRNGPPVPVDDVLGTSVSLLVTGSVPDATVPDIKGR